MVPLKQRLLGRLKLGLWISLGVLLLVWAHQQGHRQRVFEVAPLPKAVPLPLIHQTYTGWAEAVDPVNPKGEINPVKRVRADFRPKAIAKPDQQHLTWCIGTIRPSDETYYLLAWESGWLLEKAAFIEPLLLAMYRLNLGENELEKSVSLDAAVRGLPDDPEVLRSLALKLRGPALSP